MRDIEQTVEIDASPEAVYALVSDLPRMAEWSPECTAVRWQGGADGPAVGARFVGHNRAGMARWPTQGVVTAAEPGRRFGFDIHIGPIPVAHWEYEIRPGATGCTLTEWWTDRRPAALRLVADRTIGPRHAINTRGIAKTLANIKQSAESP